jgi:urate oxidase
VLSWNRYGKARVRLVKVRRGRDCDEIVDLTLAVQLEGAFEPVYVEGDNRSCVPTDTMKNTVYAMARQDPINHVEAFATRLADHFIGKPAVSKVRISVSEHRWDRLGAGQDGRAHPHAFLQPGGERWTAAIVRERDAARTQITAGLTGLVVLKTAASAFSGFPRDEYTTLADTEERILATAITARWTYRSGATDFGARERIRHALLDTFAAHTSRSVQHTLYAMGESALAACGDVTDITLSLPNRHHLLVDLTPFGLDNPNVVFVATDQPFGLIEATVSRSAAGKKPWS